MGTNQRAKINPHFGVALNVKSQEPLFPTEDEITRQIERMLASPDFVGSPQQVAFLKYVVNQTLAGNASRIKGYTVATEVFGRRSDFNQSIDPVVSVQAGRLRRAIERYYLTVGTNDPIRIDIPKGTYVPVFEKRSDAIKIDTAVDAEHPHISVMSSWPSVLIRPLSNISNDPELDFWGIGMATDLADELSRYPDIRVMTLGSGNPNTEPYKNTARFVIDGSIRSDEKSIKMILNLTDTRTGHQIWSDSIRTSNETAKLIAFQEDLASSIAVKIAGERGWIIKTLDKESKRYPPQHASVYKAALRYFEFDITYAPEAFSQALAALAEAVNIEPEYGPSWTMLARIYADLYAFDIPGYDVPLEKAYEFAQKGIRLSPSNQRSRGILAYIHLFRNDLAAGLTEAAQGLRLGPNTLYFLDGIGYLMTLLGDWERGPALIEKVMQLNPFYNNVVHYALWLNYLRQDDFINAHQETLKLNRPALFWDHLARASSYGLIGNIEDGHNAAAQLLKLKPDFSERGRMLIEHYIKFDDIVGRVIKGLNAVGIQVKS